MPIDHPSFLEQHYIPMWVNIVNGMHYASPDPDPRTNPMALKKAPPVTKTPEAPSKELATTDLSYLEGIKHVAPDDGFGADDVAVPRIKLIQSQSEEVELYPGIARIGEFWHTALDEPLGSKVKFVICERRRKYLLQAPMEDGQGILARADDAKTWDRTGSWSVKLKGIKTPVTWNIMTLDVKQSGLTEWGTSNPDDENSGPAATLFYDYLVILPDFPELGPCVMSLARTQIRAAKKGLNDKIMMHQGNGRPMQALVFEMTAIDDANDANQSFKNYRFTSAGFATKELYEQAMECRGLLARAKITDEVDKEITPKSDSEEEY